MKYTSPIALALASAPLASEAWSLRPFPSSSSMLTTLLDDTEFASPAAILRRQREMANSMFEQTDRLFQQTALAFPNETRFSSPRYEVTNNDEKFELSVDVPGLKMEDIDVSLENGYLTVRGETSTKDETSSFSSKFA